MQVKLYRGHYTNHKTKVYGSRQKDKTGKYTINTIFGILAVAMPKDNTLQIKAISIATQPNSKIFHVYKT